MRSFESGNCDCQADVDLNNRQVIEFQHSRIGYEEVHARMIDYRTVGKEVLWVIDGQCDVVAHSLRERRVFLEFKNPWKYKSFRDYECVYLNMNGLIYRLFPQRVRSHMLDVEASITDSDFVTSLRANEPPFKIPPDSIPQSRLFVKQQGAGNGKTYGIVQLILQSEFAHYDTLVYLTKQHSAVHVIRQEIKNQREKGYLPDIEFGKMGTHGKKTVLSFRHKEKNTGLGVKWRSIVVGTFDSFVYSLARLHQQSLLDTIQYVVERSYQNPLLNL